MGRFKYRKGVSEDKYAKTGKIRRGQKAHRNTDNDREPFELPLASWQMAKEDFVARVVEVHKRYAFVSPEPEPRQIKTNEVFLGTIARRFMTSARRERNLIAVGDIVKCRPTKESDGAVQSEIPTVVIENRAERTSRLTRLDPMNHELRHVLACNVDQLVIVASYLKPKVKFGLIDRYLALAEEQEIPATIVFNKKDLLAEAKPQVIEQCREMVSLYRGLGYDVVEVSALGELEEPTEITTELSRLFGDKVSLFSGHSGVGKSSLVNLFDPEINQEVEENPDIFYKGRHTTTYASFIGLKECNGWVIDTPGIRSFVIGERSAIELTHAFVELRPFLGKCKYRECRHIDEPDCQVLAAVANGDIHPGRYRSYKIMLLGDEVREGRSGLVDDSDGDDEGI